MGIFLSGDLSLIDHLTPKSFEEQVELLKTRGLLFDNTERAKRYLAYIGYQRLSVYWGSFYENTKDKDRFKNNTKFEDILNLYIFDRKLRVLFFEASERIEICFKVLLSDALCIKTSNPFWYNDETLFKSRTDEYYVNGIAKKEVCNQQWIINKINENLSKFKKSNTALKGFTDVASTPIPSWELVDMLTFGNFSNMISLINGENLTSLYELFNLPKRVLDNWLECVVGVRNICAHYGLLYKRSFSATPMSLTKSKKRSVIIDLEDCKRTFFAQFFIFNYLIKKISPTSHWSERVVSLIEENIDNPLLSYEIMGFPKNWKDLICCD